MPARKPSDEERKPKRRTVNLRRHRMTTVSNLQPGDRVTPIWDAEKWEWRLLIESENGVEISHIRLTGSAKSA